MVAISKADLNWYDSRSHINPEDNYTKDQVNFKVGDVIVHTVFGTGVIIGISGDMLDVAFKAPFGVKSLMSNHKAIKRMKN
jgi:DNA helicase-2/ATP-dependent DNA helicase PcrA